MRLNAHITYNGDCEAAFKVYKECLGGQITLLTYGSSPTAPSYPGLEDKVAHATLKVGEQTLTGADVSAEAYEKPQGFAVQLNLDRAEDARRIYEVLAKEGVVTMPLQKTFWAEHYAMLTDRFGTPWEINCA